MTRQPTPRETYNAETYARDGLTFLIFEGRVVPVLHVLMMASDAFAEYEATVSSSAHSRYVVLKNAVVRAHKAIVKNATVDRAASKVEAA